VLAGVRSDAASGVWSAIHRPVVGVCGRPPHAATIRRVLTGVDPVAVEGAVTAWALARRHDTAAAAERVAAPRNQQRRVYAVDGKNLRGAGQSGGQQTQLVCVVDHAQRLILTPTEVIDGNEIAAFITALNRLPDLRGCLIPADALHTQTGHASYLAGRGAHYLFTVKDNRPTLRRALTALPWRAAPPAADPGGERSHGRRESRTATVLDLDQRPGHQLLD
jgi:hypothetical protein